MSDSGEAPSRRLRVAMMVGNDLTADTRVRKMAVGLSNAGADVTLIGLSTSGARTEAMMAGVRIVRLPVPLMLKDAGARRRNAFPSLRLGYSSKEAMIVAKRRRKVREREIAAAVGRLSERMSRLEESERADQLQHRALQVALQVRRRALRLPIKPRRRIEQVRASVLDHRLTQRPRLVPWRDRAEALLEDLPVLSDWRRLVPYINDYELSFGPVLDELEPDVIHAHDVHMVGIAERAVARAKNDGRRILWVYDAHEYVPGLPNPDRKMIRGFVDLEREYAARADRVITVSEHIATRMRQELGLRRRPTVVLNVPVVRPRLPADGGAPSVREAAGVEEGEPLLVYSGGVSAARGLETLIDALPYLPDIHAALVVKASSRVVRNLLKLAAKLGVRGRVHVVPFVDPDEVVTYLSSADVGVHTMLGGYLNHELALPNKYFEYMHARLPMVGTDLEAMGALTRELGIGECFRSGDPVDLARAVRLVLADRARYTAPYVEHPEILDLYTWVRQEAEMVGLYEELIGRPLREGGAPDTPVLTAALTEEGRSEDERERSLWIGPTNMAGQGWAWKQAIQRMLPTTRVEVVTLQKKSPLAFPADIRVPVASWRSLEWQLSQVRDILTRHTHVLMEAGNGVFGDLTGDDFKSDTTMLNKAGVVAGVVFHGSDIRDPRRHRELEPASPYADGDSEISVRLQGVADRNSALLARYEGPRFVTTLDLLDYVPEAVWLPVVADPELWRPGGETLSRQRPLVVHVPSNSGMKGSAPVDLIAEELDGLGVIEYRRLKNMPVSAMPGLLAEADVVLDQFALGDYGALAAQAMLAGRLVIGHVADRVRERLGVTLPIVEATAENVREVLLEVAEDRDRYRSVAERGRRFALDYHSGDYAVRQLNDFWDHKVDE